MQWINKVLTKTARFGSHAKQEQRSATIEVLNNQVAGLRIGEVKDILNRELDIRCILHSKDNRLEATTDSTTLSMNDLIVVSAYGKDMDAIEALLGRLKSK